MGRDPKHPAAVGLVEHAATWVLIALFLIGIAAIILRYLFNSSLAWSSEVSRYLVPWLTFLGAAVAVWTDSQLKVIQEPYRRLPPPLRLLLLILSEGFVLLILGIIAYHGFAFASSMSRRSLVSLPGVSMGLVYASVPVGALLMILFRLARLVLPLASRLSRGKRLTERSRG
jgi:TRAP-type C4-dicarboxylate transport system permease small subunit